MHALPLALSLLLIFRKSVMVAQWEQSPIELNYCATYMV